MIWSVQTSKSSLKYTTVYNEIFMEYIKTGLVSINKVLDYDVSNMKYDGASKG